MGESVRETGRASERNESWLVWRCLLPAGGCVAGGICSCRRERAIVPYKSNCVV